MDDPLRPDDRQGNKEYVVSDTLAQAKLGFSRVRGLGVRHIAEVDAGVPSNAGSQ